jgi:hypothetical protein
MLEKSLLVRISCFVLLNFFATAVAAAVAVAVVVVVKFTMSPQFSVKGQTKFFCIVDVSKQTLPLNTNIMQTFQQKTRGANLIETLADL